jgi:hypothetical protein
LQEVGYPKAVTHIFYPRHTPAADRVANILSIALEAHETVGLTPEEIESPLSFPRGKEQPGIAIIFDDASATGRTTQQMLECVERRGFLHIVALVLCNRASRLRSRYLQKISRYGKANVSVKYLTELPIPSYSETDCPQCHDIADLNHLHQQIKHIKPLGQIINEQIEQRRLQRVAVVLEPNNMRVFQSTPLEDRISEARLRTYIELARTSLAFRKRLSDIAEQHAEQPDMALKLIRVVFRETYAFRHDSAIWHEVLYDNARGRLVDAFAYFLDGTKTLTPPDVDCVAGVFSLLDPDRMLGHLETIVDRLDELTLLRVVAAMLRSERIENEQITWPKC